MTASASVKRQRRADTAWSVAVGVLALAVYGLTLYPDVTGGDSGELVAGVATGGVLHPPGYPLYALLAKPFSLLPLGTLAGRLNFFSAVCDAAAAAILHLTVTRATGSRWAGLVTAALFAFSPGIWAYAISAEVFALDNLLIALLLLLAVAYDEHAERRYALLGALVIGLGLSNHHTILFTAGPLALWALWRGRDASTRPRTAGLLVLLACAGLLPYLRLPLASGRFAAVSWGETSTWSGFWTHVLRREFGTFRLASEGLAHGATASSTALAWTADVLQQIGWWGLPLLGLGVTASVRASREKPLRAVLLVLPLVSVAVLAVLGNLPATDPRYRGILARFWQQPDIVVFVLCGFGFAGVAERLPRAWPGALGLLLVALPLGLRFRSMDRHRSRLVRSYGAEILRAAPASAVLFTRGDLITNTVRYLQVAERLRPDVHVVDLELLGFTWERTRLAALYPEIAVPGPRYMPGAPDGFAIADLFDANVGRFPILVCGGLKEGDTSADATYGRWPFGLCELVHAGTEPVSLDDWIRDSEAALPRIDFASQPHPEGSWEDVVWRDYWEVRQARAAHLLMIAGADPARRPYVALAASLLGELVAANPGAPPHVYRNLAIALGRQGTSTPGERARTATAWRRYLEVAPATDPGRPAIVEELRRLESP